MNRSRLLITVVAFFVLSTTIHAQDDSTDSGALYGKAVEAFNAGQLLEAKAILVQLIERYPDNYKAHDLYWNVVGRTDDAVAMRAAVTRSLKQFEQIPPERRNETFYINFIKGYEILEDKGRVESLRKEAIAKFPRGTVAQMARLDEAREEKDPIKSAAMFQGYIDEFNDNISWTQLAAHNKLTIMIEHPDAFDLKAWLVTAEQCDQLTKRFIGKFGNPFRYMATLREIADVLVEKDPAGSLTYARKGLAFIQETWPSTDEFEEKARFIFWPAMLRANVALKDWQAADRIGKTLVRELDSESLPISIRTEIDEAKVRRDYAVVLEQMESFDQAREQLALAASINNKIKGELDAFFVRHPLDPAVKTHFETTIATKITELAQRREQQIKNEVLASEQRQPATNFALKDLAGKTVSLADFRGKVLVLDFWATWCGPCRGELEEMNAAYAKYKTNPKVVFAAISIDADKAKVPLHAKEKGYSFPILLSDGTIESAYAIQTIPKLYIIDPAGNIRFNDTGYIKDGYYLKKLDWMIEAALK